MKSAPLWKFSVTTTLSAEDAIAALLEATFGQPACSYLDADSQQVSVSVYLSERPNTSNKRGELTLILKRMVGEGLCVGAGRISLEKIPSQEWAESWKRHFKPISIRSALLVKPSWSRCRPRKGQAVVVLDPGLSFGTGQHPTTAFCLRQLVDLRRQGEEQSCLDVGSGSGILAIAAAKLGYRPVNAMDCDADAVRIARANARRNGISSRISFSKQDLTKLSLRGVPEYSVICANLIANLLVAERQRLLSRLRTDGNLVAAGILGTEFEQVQQAFESAGLRLKASRLQGEWRSGVFGGGAEGCERSRDLCR